MSGLPSGKPYWQCYWYDLRFRALGAPSFEPLGDGRPQQVPNTWLATGPVGDFADWILAEAAGELDDLRGELRVLIYTDARPGPDAEPVLARTASLGATRAGEVSRSRTRRRR
ncbi:hypothetical protein [Longispora albida]|uniref:hypothetical protein n=1 Tax=Longispora albida TaxID=203523 RepID=UPI00036342AD|nr:hypothetical protein [Longispora albida]